MARTTSRPVGADQPRELELAREGHQDVGRVMDRCHRHPTKHNVECGRLKNVAAGDHVRPGSIARTFSIRSVALNQLASSVTACENVALLRTAIRYLTDTRCSSV